MDIKEILRRRTDLSTFLVHLTRTSADLSAADRLESILQSGQILAGSNFGAAVARLVQAKQTPAGQECVCFTETPIEHIHLLLQDIDDRQVKFEPYGIAITKRVGRMNGLNPVWYIDITPGHNWLTTPLNHLIDGEIQ
jgi:hypothetical protein